jgi:hypothetical protein
VRGLDVDPTIEGVGRRVGDVDIGKEWCWHVGF